MLAACPYAFLLAPLFTGGGGVVVLPEPGGEHFVSTHRQDPARSGVGMWGGGLLVPGPGGGSGRLGDLIVASGETRVLSTDREVFAPGGLLDDYDPVTGMPGEASIAVTNGVFEFATVDVRDGGTLRFDGARPARVYARGELRVRGTLDVSGHSPGPFPSLPCDVGIADPSDPLFCADLDPSAFLGQAGGPGGPGGSAGGRGGDLPQADATLQGVVGGLENPNAVIVLDGEAGGGVPVPNAFAPLDFVGGGVGGVHWPPLLPPDVFDLGDLFLPDFSLPCTARQAGANGGGGALASDGGESKNSVFGTGGSTAVPKPPPTPGGDALVLDEAARTLDPAAGLLRGGAGGGGGGAHVGETASAGVLFDCLPEPGEPVIADFVQSIGGGGGGGGGALQGQAGALVAILGSVDASGGTGGSREKAFGDRLDNLSGGGAGAGGAVLLQGPGVQVATGAGRIRVAAGAGGKAGAVGRGGQGGVGLVRVESGIGAGLELDFDTLVSKVAPTPAEMADYPGAPVPEDVVSVATWAPEDTAPGTFSGVQSCWIFPDDQPADLTFLEDTPVHPGWNLLVVTNLPGVGAVPYRGRNDVIHGSLEELLGSDLGLAPFVVRFQGARTAAPLDEPCYTDVDDPTEIVPGSLTPWVRHPAELNDFTGDPALAPNAVRFQVVFDRRNGLLPFIAGVTGLSIRAQE